MTVEYISMDEPESLIFYDEDEEEEPTPRIFRAYLKEPLANGLTEFEFVMEDDEHGPEEFIRNVLDLIDGETLSIKFRTVLGTHLWVQDVLIGAIEEL